MTKPLAKAVLLYLSVDPIKAKQTAIRHAWYAALESQGARQCVGTYEDFSVDWVMMVEEHGNHLGPRPHIHNPVHVCALALLGELTYGPYWWWDLPVGKMPSLAEIGAKAGLDVAQTEQVIAMNDGKLRWPDGTKKPCQTFRQISRRVRKWFGE